MLDECAAEWSANQSARLTTAASRGAGAPGIKKVERETGFEPATSTLARSHSTTELFPLATNGDRTTAVPGVAMGGIAVTNAITVGRHGPSMRRTSAAAARAWAAGRRHSSQG